MRKYQEGSSLVVALVLLAIITLVAVYSIEGSIIQTKMVANSLFTNITYQECRNEQESNIRFYNQDGGINREQLLDAKALNSVVFRNSLDSDPLNQPLTYLNPASNLKSQLESTWSYLRIAPASRGGFEIEQSSQSQAFLFENACISNFRFSTNDQTLGASVDGLVSGQNVH